MSEIHDDDAERALLGCVLTENSAMVRVRARLRPADFHARAHQRVWEAMVELDRTGRAIDHLTLSAELKARGQLAGVGGPAYLMQLDTSIPSVAGLETYAAIVADRAQRRALARLGRRLADCAGDLNHAPADLQAKTLKHLAGLHSADVHFKPLGEILAGVFERIHAVEEGTAPPVCPTGLGALDEIIGGLQPELFAVGARTGVGKSAFAATLVQNIAKQGIRVGVFSLEDSGDWLAWRYVAHASGVNQFILRYRKKTEAEWTRIGASAPGFDAYSQNILVDDRSNLTSEELCQAADDMVINHGVRVILVDHVSEMNHRAKRAERYDLAIEQSLQDLRGLQKRHSIPVVLLCQFAEERDAKPDAIPSLADFSNAKVIGKMARVVLALVRAPESDEMKIAVLKQTNGAPGRFATLRFINGAAMIRDIESKPSNVIQMPLLRDEEGA